MTDHRSRRSAVAAWALATELLVALPARAQDQPVASTPSVTVTGNAAAEVAPDTVEVVFGVVTQRPGAAEAMAENNRALAAAIAAVKAEGVEGKDVATLDAGLTPITSAPERGTPKITGYRATNRLQVRLRPADRAGAILGKLIERGVNDVESVSAVVTDDAEVRDRLKGEAARDARRQAALYASALDLSLATVLRIELDGAPAMPRMAMAKRFDAASVPVPIELGRQTLAESVRVTFALQPR